MEFFTDEIQYGFDGIGASFGLRRAHRINADEATVGVLIPYGTRLSAVIGEDRDISGDAIGITVTGYVELHVDVGLGVEWNGIRSSMGVQSSSMASGLSLDDEFDLNGTKLGPFAEASYKHPRFPVFGSLRVAAGDYEVLELSIGVAW